MNQEADPALVKGLQTDYQAAEWTGEDTSGIRPLGPIVIILCDKVAEITAGGIELPATFAERMNLASEQGVIAAVGKGAFAIHEDGSSWRDYLPKPGDRVYFEKYAGRLAMGADGKIYRLMDYHSIAAVYEKGSRLVSDNSGGAPENMREAG